MENDSTHTYEQNSGHIVGAGAADYWLQFLASRQRYVIERDGSERLIIVDEHKTSISDMKVGSLTFKWHYANPANTVVDKVDIALAGLTVTGPSVVNGEGNAATFRVTYSPSDTTQRGVRWSVTSGSEYASIDEYTGTMTVNSGAAASAVIVRATSTANAAIFAEKSVTATYTSSARRYTLTVECATSGAEVDVQVNDSSAVSVYTSPMTLEENTTVKVWAYKDGMISSDVQTVTMTSDKTVTVACKAYPKWNLGSEFSVDNAGGAITPTVTDTDSVGWELGTSADWINVNSSGTGFIVDENTAANGRTGGVTLICVANGQAVASCTVSQAATATEQAPSIAFETEKKEVAATTTTATVLFSVKNLTGLTVRVDGTLVNASATLNQNTGCIIVHFDANTSESTRAASVYVSGTRTDGGGEYTKGFSIIQAAVSTGHLLTVNVSPSDAGVRVGVGSAASTAYTSPMRIEDGARVSVVASKTGYASKSEVFTMDSDKTLDWTLTANPSWTLPTSLEINPDGDNITFDITDSDSVGWRIETPDWCRVDDDVTAGNGDHSSSLSFDPNDTGADREGTVSLYAGDSSTSVESCKLAQFSPVEIIDMDVSRAAVSGPEWQLVTEGMAAETAALSSFVGWYKSMIEGVTNGETVTELTIAVGEDCDIAVEFCSDAESSYDYLVAAAMDETEVLSKENADTLADVSTKGRQGIANKVRKTYTLSAGTHVLQIIYMKDGSQDKETDSGYYRILSEAQE